MEITPWFEPGNFKLKAMVRIFTVLTALPILAYTEKRMVFTLCKKSWTWGTYLL